MRAIGLGREKPNGDRIPRRRSVTYIVLFTVAAATLITRWAFDLVGREERALHGDGETAIGAIEPVLRRMPAKDRLPFLLKSVQDPSPGLRYAAVDALSHYPTAESAAAIEHAYEDSASIVRERALETLRMVDHERGIRLLLAALRDEDMWMRETAILQLALRDPPKKHPAGQSAVMVSAKTQPVPRNAMIAPLADVRSVPALIKVLDDPDDIVTRYAVGILRQLTKRGDVYHSADGPAGKRRVLDEWKQWWKANSARYAAPEYADIRQVRPMRSDPAPTFSLRDIDGHEVRLASLRGHPVLLNFWGTWCSPCRIETPNLEKLYRNYKTSGLNVIGVAVAEQGGENGLRIWCAQQGLTYRQMLSTPELQRSYGDIEEVPVTVLIDKQGRIRYRWEAERDYSTFEAAATRLLAE